MQLFPYRGSHNLLPQIIILVQEPASLISAIFCHQPCIARPINCDQPSGWRLARKCHKRTPAPTQTRPPDQNENRQRPKPPQPRQETGSDGTRQRCHHRSVTKLKTFRRRPIQTTDNRPFSRERVFEQTARQTQPKLITGLFTDLTHRGPTLQDREQRSEPITRSIGRPPSYKREVQRRKHNEYSSESIMGTFIPPVPTISWRRKPRAYRQRKTGTGMGRE